MSDISPFFVSTEWLAANLGAPDLVAVDGTFFMPHENRDAAADYLAAHIPGAVFFDIDAIADHTTALPHMLPTPDAFSDAMQSLGIGDRMRIVVYDAAGLRGVARVWWTLRVFGASNVKILDGGLDAWKAEGRSLESGPVDPKPVTFTPAFDAAAVANLETVKDILASRRAQLVDARPAARFYGDVPEPRPGLTSGHMPGAISVPATDVIEGSRMKPPAAIAAIFAKAGVDMERPIVTTCGSGVTAAILLLALETIGKTGVVLYDGSWSEWGAQSDLPVATR